ncbi:MAG: acetolactate synthase small subunit, partial [Spirochaetes bacterium]|nr:acetolactate synthase small subunit [Spirochaetota bacterium]
NKLIDTIKITDHSEVPSIQRELALIKVNAPTAKKQEIFQAAQLFKAEIVDVAEKTITLSVDAEPEKIDNLIELLRPYAIKELIRSGRISMSKG